MSNDIMVTVWCLAYNHEKYIRQALESVVSQKTTFKYEVLVHDDASTDAGTVDIIKEFAQKYPDIIKPILQTENQYKKGVEKTLNFMLPNAKGKYIAYCECDDYWVDEYKLQKQFDIMEQNPEASMCVHRVQCVNEDGSINNRVFPNTSYDIVGDGILSREKCADLLLVKGVYPFHTSSYFVRKNILGTELYKSFEFLINGDRKALLSGLNCGDFYYVDSAMSHRRMMAKGSYNERLLKKSKDELLQLRINFMDANMMFDKMSDGDYHDKVVMGVYNQIFNCLLKFDNKSVFDYLKKIQSSCKYKFGSSLYLDIKYIMMKYFPCLLSFCISIYKKLSK